MATGAAVESKTDRPIEGWRDRREEGERGGGTDVGVRKGSIESYLSVTDWNRLTARRTDSRRVEPRIADLRTPAAFYRRTRQEQTSVPIQIDFKVTRDPFVVYRLPPFKHSSIIRLFVRSLFVHSGS